MQKKIHGQKKVVYIYFGILPCCTHGFSMYSRHCIVSFLFRPNWTELEWTMRIQTTNTNQLQCKQNAWTTPNKLKFANIVRIETRQTYFFSIDLIEKASRWFWRFRKKYEISIVQKFKNDVNFFIPIQWVPFEKQLYKKRPQQQICEAKNERTFNVSHVLASDSNSINPFIVIICNLHAHLYDTRLCMVFILWNTVESTLSFMYDGDNAWKKTEIKITDVAKKVARAILWEREEMRGIVQYEDKKRSSNGCEWWFWHIHRYARAKCANNNGGCTVIMYHFNSQRLLKLPHSCRLILQSCNLSHTLCKQMQH